MGGIATTSYRGMPSIPSVPVAPYAFSGTSIPPGNNPLRQHPTAPHLRQENRTASAPVVPFTHQTLNPPNSLSRYRLPPGGSPLDPSSPHTLQQQTNSKDDSSILSQAPKQFSQRPQSTVDLGSVSSTKPQPDRYRRNHRRAETAAGLTTNVTLQGGSALPSGSGMATVGHLYSNPAGSSSSPSLSTYSLPRGSQAFLGHPIGEAGLSGQRLSAVDDMSLPKQTTPELAKRYRRRSISGMAAEDRISQALDAPSQAPSQPKSYAQMLASSVPQERNEPRGPASQRPESSHGRNHSAESSVSGRSGSRPSSSKRDAPAPNATNLPAAQQASSVGRNEVKIVNIPPRGSSDANKRITNPSPLSQPMPMSPQTPATKEGFAAAIQQKPTAPVHTPTLQAAPSESPAAQSLAGLNKKEGKKEGKSSRLRRAFSFGSAAELRKVSAENNASSERAKLRKDRYADEHEAEQAAIAQKQEAGGLGEGIYSGQGQFYTGSTDNLSISSTASSASVMIRKMGKGVKKGSRSLVGLFRPKSVVGVPAADAGAPEPSVAQVSMVTVEAEREKVNVNANPHEQAGGGTGFPKLERNSMDAASLGNEPTIAVRNEDLAPRRSIVGGETERAEILAAVKKGILKRTGTDSGNSSPSIRPVDSRGNEPILAAAPRFNESPHSNSSSTLNEDQPPRLGHRRTDSVTIEGEDYFLALGRFADGESRSVPGTPRSLAAARNISFSPRIQFHDTWPSGEYDRRGEIATCNRLTPMLAQQIKEELNTFKMEMEVHEQSKVYTHFF